MNGNIFPHVVTELLLGPVRKEAGEQGKSEIDECLGTFLTTPSHLARTKAGGCDSQHPSPSRENRKGAHIQGHPHMPPSSWLPLARRAQCV